MITEALILLPPGGDPHPLTPLAGLSLFERALFTAARAGARRCYVVAGEDAADLERSLEGKDRLATEVVFVARADAGAGGADCGEGSHTLIFGADTVFHPDLVRELDQGVEDGEARAVRAPGGAYALLLAPSARLRSILAAVARGETPLVHGDANGPLGNTPVAVVSAGGRFVRRVEGTAHIRATEAALLRSLENAPRDGLVDAYVHRKISYRISRLLLRTSLTPNQITLLSAVVALAGAACFTAGSYAATVTGAVLFQLSAIGDCVDGEIARAKFLESQFGEWMDITFDALVFIAVFLGIGVAVYRQGGVAHALALGVTLALGALLCFPVVTFAEKTEELGRARGGWEDRVINGMVAGLTTRDPSAVVLAFSVAAKLDWFLWGAAIGAHLFWLALAALMLRSGRLLTVLRGHRTA